MQLTVCVVGASRFLEAGSNVSTPPFFAGVLSMKATPIIEELKEILSPYLFYWDTWIADENCNLSSDEVTIINALLKSNFDISLFDHFRYYTQNDALRAIIHKLRLGYPVFKELVILHFLTSLIRIAKAYGFDAFIQTPVSQLNIPGELKNALRALNAYTLQQMFVIYKADDFGRGWLYKKVVDFHITYAKQIPIINQQKPIAMKTDSS